MVERIPSDRFARTFSQRGPQLAWFLGAGASAAANIPTGSDMIADFKTRLFCAQANIPRPELDATDPIWEERVASYFDGAHGLPPAGDPIEYAATFEAVFPDARDRRAYIEDAVKRGTTSYAHRVLAALITSGTVRCIFATNFDPLIERAAVMTDELLPAELRAHLTVGALDSVDRAIRCLRDDKWPLLVKLHGDYQSERLKNIPGELQAQDQQLRKVLVEALGRFGLVVVGYSGRDESILDAFEEAVSMDDPLPAGLWWATRPGTTPLPRVMEFLERAEAAGVETAVVDSENFDELAGDIEREVRLDGPLLQHINALRPNPLVEPMTLPTLAVKSFPVLRCSALQLLQIPTEARQVGVDRPLTSAEARQLVREANVWATVASRGQVVTAFGQDEDLKRAFSAVGGQLQGTVPLRPTVDSVDLGLVYDAFTRAITRQKPLRPILRSRGHHVVVRPPTSDRSDGRPTNARRQLDVLQAAYQDSLTGRVAAIGCPYAEAIRVRLEHWEGRWWCVYEPFTWVDLPRKVPSNSAADQRGESGDVDADAAPVRAVAADWRRERWARRYNPKWNEIIAAWANVIAPASVTELSAHYFEGEGINATFLISSTTAWCSPGQAPSA